jgi:hypothetical protein
MESQRGVAETAELTPLQWQLIMKCWKMNLRPGQTSWWGPTAWRLGALFLWAYKLRKLNGPGFTWPLFMFANALPERLMALGKIHVGAAGNQNPEGAPGDGQATSPAMLRPDTETCRTVSSTSRCRNRRPGSSAGGRWTGEARHLRTTKTRHEEEIG